MRRSAGIACAAAAALLLAVLAGCGGRVANSGDFVDRNPLPVDTLQVAMDELGRYGGRFVAGATTSPKTFNPIMSTESSSNDVISRMFVSLTDIDYRTQDNIPALAKAWDVSPDGLTYTFHLRRGARFSDGVPITGEDVRFSFDAAMDTTLRSALRDGLTRIVGGREVACTYSAPDSFTFVVIAPGSDALMLSHLGVVPVLPKHVLERARKEGRLASAYATSTPPESLVTSGPWRLASFAEGQQTVLTRNPWWYGVDARGRRLPYLDALVFRVARDQNTAAQMFHAGELDGLDNVKPDDYHQYEAEQQAKHFTLHDVGTSFNVNFLWFNLNRVHAAGEHRPIGAPEVEPYKYAWFSNRDFRRAISMAIDRDAIVRGPFFGSGVREWGLMTSGNARWHDSTLTAPDHDIEGAKRLLDGIGLRDRNGDGIREDAAGHKVAFSLMFNSDNRTRAAIATLLQDDLAKVGIQLTPAGIDFNTMGTKLRGDKQYDAALMGLASGVPADPAMGAPFWKSSGRSHYWDVLQPEGHADSPEEARIDALFQRNVESLDPAERHRTYHEMSTILNDECFVVWLPSAGQRIPVSNAFGNVHPVPLPPRILWNADRIFRRAGGGPA
jgi:peptide/nickel transport system substrate-binding protein